MRRRGLARQAERDGRVRRPRDHDLARKTAYLVPVDSATASVLLNGQPAPIYGHYNFFITDKLELVLPMTPNGRQQLTWLQNWVAENGPEAQVTFTYGSLVSNYHVKFHEAGIAYNLTRF